MRENGERKFNILLYKVLMVKYDLNRLNSIVFLDVSFHTFLLCMIMPLLWSGSKEGNWIGNDANLPHPGTVQKCPFLFTTLKGERDVGVCFRNKWLKRKIDLCLCLSSFVDVGTILNGFWQLLINCYLPPNNLSRHCLIFFYLFPQKILY